MKTDVICPYCKKKFEVDVVIRMNPFVKNIPQVSEVGINKYYEIKEVKNGNKK